MRIETNLELQGFYPADLEVANICQTDGEITIKMFARSRNCPCPKCGTVSCHRHGTYERIVQDLPILGKTVWLLVNAYEYQCDDPDCSVATFVETINGFLSHYSRMTERCADFICTLALETSCEGCARICRSLGIRVSGDTVIRLLLRRYESLSAPDVGDVIGIDDFAYKKRHTYGTIIVNEKTHEPITLLDGRDGETLRKWLKNNKHVKVVTRDRASAYAKVIAEELPDAMQVADRFHLHQNLLEAIKKALNHELPATITIPHGEESTTPERPCKKNHVGCG